MNSSALADSLRHLRGRLAAHERNEDNDEHLLDAFTRRRDDSAFAALVRRHGPMVLHVCRRVLGHEQDAEDAFQASFLVFARNAASLRNKASLVSFLHGIAHRTAMKAKQSAARRRKYEVQAPAHSPVSPAEELSWREVRALLDEEIARLPEIYRVVFVLFYLEDLSREETARRLGLKDATVAKRLVEARQRLSRRLARRGVELTAVLAATAVATHPASALPAGLLTKTMQSVLAMASGKDLAGVVSATVIELVHGATTAVMMSKAKMAALLLLTATLLGGVGMCFLASPPRPGERGRVSAPSLGALTRPRSPEVVEVGGRVVDPDGKPVAGAKVVLQQRRPNNELSDFFPAPATGTTDADGRFRFSGNVHRNAPVCNYQPMLTLTAHVPGYGPAAVETNSPDELTDRTLRLVKDDVPLQGRILNLEGRPIAGVTVRPVAVVATAANDLGRLIAAIESNKNLWEDLPKDCYPNIVFSAIRLNTSEAIPKRRVDARKTGNIPVIILPATTLLPTIIIASPSWIYTFH